MPVGMGHTLRKEELWARATKDTKEAGEKHRGNVSAPGARRARAGHLL